MARSDNKKVQIIEGDLDLLVELAECRLMTIRQMAVLLGRTNRGLARRLRLLVPQDIVRTVQRPPSGVPGRPDHVLCLGEAGLAHLKANGRAQADAPFDLFSARRVDCVDHELLVSEFRVQSAQLPAVVPVLSSRFLTARSWALFDAETGTAPVLREPATARTRDTAEFVPDGVLLLRHAELGKTLLFFVEADMGTQPLRSPRNGVDLDTKIRRYRGLFSSGGYCRYEALAGSPLRGFRLLIVCGNPARLAKVLPQACQSGPCDFVWATDRGRMTREGIWSPIWHKATHDGPQAASILGGVGPASCPRPEDVEVAQRVTSLQGPPVQAGTSDEPSVH